ncbi:unnamed protein product [Notodromas monacha]|uniref:Uncharacterized protein n=1 Tax=Notodromas monacha TaxID=399045 RepID=A0A7R9G8X0_9CRUS|nr:unnamed protein product [Notodromas monacha]CAG0913656.1 unnamed protein product [Notodromas monacha]
MYNVNKDFTDFVGSWEHTSPIVAGASSQAYLSELEHATKAGNLATSAQVAFIVGRTALKAIPSSFVLIVTAVAICNVYGYVKKLQRSCGEYQPGNAGAAGDGGECGVYDEDTSKCDAADGFESDPASLRSRGLVASGDISEIVKKAAGLKTLPYERIETPGIDPYVWSPPQSIFIPSGSNSETAEDETEGRPAQLKPLARQSEKRKDIPYERISTPGHDPYLWDPPTSIFHPSPTPPGTPFPATYQPPPPPPLPPNDDYDSTLSSSEDG